jgi:hypothetical protein
MKKFRKLHIFENETVISRFSDFTLKTETVVSKSPFSGEFRGVGDGVLSLLHVICQQIAHAGFDVT